MNRPFYCIFLITILSLLPAVSKAERTTTTHNFNSMTTPPATIEYSDGYKVGKTALLTYTCSGTGAQFGAVGSEFKVCLQLPQNGSTVTTTRVEELAAFQIHLATSGDYTSLKVKVSTDSIAWSNALSGDSIRYSSTGIEVSIPRNHYFVKIYNTKKADANIATINWYQDHCNCFTYEP